MTKEFKQYTFNHLETMHATIILRTLVLGLIGAVIAMPVEQAVRILSSNAL